MTAETIVFPDATLTIVDILEAALPGFGCDVPIGGHVPNPRPAVFVRVLRTGGVRATLVTDAAQVTVESWASRTGDAHDLAQLVRAVLLAAPGAAGVVAVEELSGPADLPDPESNQHRFTQSFLVHTRGAAVEPAGS